MAWVVNDCEKIKVDRVSIIKEAGIKNCKTPIYVEVGISGMISNLEGARLIRITAHIKTKDTIVRIAENTGFGFDRTSAEPSINFSAVEPMTSNSTLDGVINSGAIHDS